MCVSIRRSEESFLYKQSSSEITISFAKYSSAAADRFYW